MVTLFGLKGQLPMFALMRNFTATIVGVAILLAFVTLSAPGRTNELMMHNGPVGPYEPILTTVGSKRVIAFYLPGSGGCAVHAVIWDLQDIEAHRAARFRARLNAEQVFHIDNADNISLNLICGTQAATLAIISTGEDSTFGIARADRESVSQGETASNTEVKAPGFSPQRFTPAR
jgi:hypothetical protein